MPGGAWRRFSAIFKRSFRDARLLAIQPHLFEGEYHEEDFDFGAGGFGHGRFHGLPFQLLQ